MSKGDKIDVVAVNDSAGVVDGIENFPGSVGLHVCCSSVNHFVETW